MSTPRHGVRYVRTVSTRPGSCVVVRSVSVLYSVTVSTRVCAPRHRAAAWSPTAVRRHDRRAGRCPLPHGASFEIGMRCCERGRAFEVSCASASGGAKSKQSVWRRAGTSMCNSSFIISPFASSSTCPRGRQPGEAPRELMSRYPSNDVPRRGTTNVLRHTACRTRTKSTRLCTNEFTQGYGIAQTAASVRLAASRDEASPCILVDPPDSRAQASPRAPPRSGGRAPARCPSPAASS